ncbi:MAG: helix-turn-helix domain-containing protein [Rhodospirillaceae bacterium]|nr:helix-turn-helix domain-containing protein [Rhodospirillaceae bacterium]
MNRHGARKYLTTKQAAEYLGLSPRTLERMRREGGGPVYRKHGRHVLYHIDDLDAWSKARARPSTAGQPVQGELPFEYPTDDRGNPPT